MATQQARRENRWTVPGQYQRSIKRVPRDAVAEILSAVNMLDLLHESSVHVALSADSTTGTAHCPFHAGKGDHRTLLVDKEHFECSRCGFRGSPLGWLMYHDGLGFFESLEHLVQKTGIHNEARPSTSDLTTDLAFKHEHLRRACTAYQRQLTSDQRAMAYLQGRGISRASIERYRLGWSSGTGAELLDGNWRNHRALWQAGILFRQTDGDYRPRFRHRIMFPIRDLDGNTTGFGARTIDDTQGRTSKYINSPASPLFNKGATLYGLHEAHPAIVEKDRLCIVEGYTDVIATAQAGIGNVVATLGTSITVQHLEVALSVASHVTLCLDADVAGRRRTVPALANALPVAKDHHRIDVLALPSGMDPDAFFRQHDAEDFTFLARNTVPLEQGLFLNFDTLDNQSIGERARLGVYAADLILDTQSTALATRIQRHAESVLQVSLDTELERARARRTTSRE